MRYSKCNLATLFAAALVRATIYGCYVASSGICTCNRASYRVGDGLLWVLVAMATVTRGSSLCEGCETSNGNRALACKGCGKLLSTRQSVQNHNLSQRIAPKSPTCWMQNWKQKGRGYCHRITGGDYSHWMAIDTESVAIKPQTDYWHWLVAQ